MAIFIKQNMAIFIKQLIKFYNNIKYTKFEICNWDGDTLTRYFPVHILGT